MNWEPMLFLDVSENAYTLLLKEVILDETGALMMHRPPEFNGDKHQNEIKFRDLYQKAILKPYLKL